jgi:hypothetical protein
VSWVDEHEPDEDEINAALDDIYGEARGVRLNTTKPRKKTMSKHQRKGKKGRTSPVVDYVRSLGDYKVTSEVAEELGVSDGLVRKLAKKRVTQAPSKVAPFGDTHVHLYTKADVAALRKYLDENRKVVDYEDFYKEES